MNNDFFYRSFLNRDRLVHIADADIQICEKLADLFRLDGFQVVVSGDAGAFAARVRTH